MRLSTAQNTQNLGTFHVQDTAFKSGDSSKDRQSGGPMYTPYQHGDQVMFQSRTAQLQMPAAPQVSGFANLLQTLMNLDIRFFIALAATFAFASIFHAFSGMNIVVAGLVAVPFFFIWYVMSFFNVQRVMDNMNHAQAARHQSRRLQTMQIPATF